MARADSDGVRVLVTDAQERSVLAAIRCLHRAGVSVTAAATTATAPGLWSRCVTRRRVVPDPAHSVAEFVDELEAILTARTHHILLPGTDASLLAVSLHRERLEAHTRLGLPEHDVVERSLDKNVLASVAAQFGLGAPETRTCRCYDEALRAARAFGYPVFVKPLHTVVETGGVTRRWASRLIMDDAGVAAAVHAFGHCIVQRRVRGSVVSLGGVATANGLLGAVASRYIRTWPPVAGNVSFSETIPMPARLEEHVTALVAQLGWIGIFELELIHDLDGSFAAIDFNPRAYGSLRLADAAGVPLAALWCRSVLGEHPASAEARVGVRYRYDDADLRHVFLQLREGHPAAAIAVARPRRRVTHAFFAADDPLPIMARGLQLAQSSRHRRRGAGHGLRTRS